MAKFLKKKQTNKQTTTDKQNLTNNMGIEGNYRNDNREKKSEEIVKCTKNTVLDVIYVQLRLDLTAVNMHRRRQL